MTLVTMFAPPAAASQLIDGAPPANDLGFDFAAILATVGQDSAGLTGHPGEDDDLGGATDAVADLEQSTDALATIVAAQPPARPADALPGDGPSPSAPAVAVTAAVEPSTTTTSATAVGVAVATESLTPGLEPVIAAPDAPRLPTENGAANPAASPVTAQPEGEAGAPANSGATVQGQAPTRENPAPTGSARPAATKSPDAAAIAATIPQRTEAERSTEAPEGARIATDSRLTPPNVTATDPAPARVVAPAAAEAQPVSAPPRTPMAEQLSRPLVNIARAGDGQHTITIGVAPENLGPVKVQAHVDGKHLRIELVTPSAASHDAVRQVIADIRRDFAAQGFTADIGVTQQGSGSTGSQGGNQQGGGSLSSSRGDQQGGGSSETPNREAPHSRQSTGEGAKPRGNYRPASTLDVLA